MAVYVFTDDPEGLLKKIKAAIQANHIETWTYDGDGDFIHGTSSGQWKSKAWLRPTPTESKLIFNVVHPKSGLKRDAYAVYHGRFIEMLVRHFPKDFTLAAATANLTDEEKLKPESP